MFYTYQEISNQSLPYTLKIWKNSKVQVCKNQIDKF